MSKASIVLSWFFWIAFGAFLLASVPHVAWFFSVFEPHGNDGSLDWSYWLISYLIAISIDVTVFLLSMTVAGLSAQGKSKGLISSVWIFILVLACLSWWINDKYATHFEQTGAIAVTPLNISFWGWYDLRIPDANALVASCFQILAVAYTWISDKIAAGRAEKTVEELEDEARKLARKLAAKSQIAAQKRANLETNLHGIIDVGDTLFQRLKKKKAGSGQDEILDEDEENLAQDSAQDPDVSRTETGEFSAQHAVNLRIVSSKNADESSDENADSTSLPSGTYVSMADAVLWTGYKEDTLRKKAKDGQVGMHPKDPNKVKRSTILGLKNPKSRTKSEQSGAQSSADFSQKKDRDTGPIVLPSSAQDSSSLGMVEQAMYDKFLEASAQKQAEMRAIASTKTLDELVQYLKAEYPQNAGYFTPTRVQNVMRKLGVVVTISDEQSEDVV